VTDGASVESAISDAVAQLGGLDVLIHAAGVAPGSPASEMGLDHWQAAMDINATGTFLTNQAGFPHLKENGEGDHRLRLRCRHRGLSGQGRLCGREGGDAGLGTLDRGRVGAVRHHRQRHGPGDLDPDVRTTRASMTPEQLAAHDEGMAKPIPLGGRRGDVEHDFAPVMAFVSSGGARFMTGEVFAIDGGGTMVR